jgi:predicted TIM-barrel fold metal-dependent hydrolase
MIIDSSSHLIVSEVEAMLAYRGDFQLIQKNFDSVSSDPVKWIALMDRYGIDTQVLTQSTPVLEGLNAAEAAEVCRISNDAIGQIARAYPDRFVPFAVATLLDVDEAIRELERAVCEWGCRGVTIDTNHNNQRLDDPLFHPFFEKVCELDIPVILHPMAWCS